AVFSRTEPSSIKNFIEDGSVLENTAGTFSLLEEFNEQYKNNNPNAFSVGEVWSNTKSIIPYVQNERLDVCFEFDLAGAILNAVNTENPKSIQEQMQLIQSSYPALQYGTFLTNHDMNRVFNQLGSNVDKMKLAAAIYLSLPGIPFIYYGEELNMMGTGAHENIRRPMQWTADTHAGFSNTTPWYGLGFNYQTNNVVVMESNSNSILNHYKKLIHIRNVQGALRRGNFLNIESSENEILSFARVHDNQAVVVVSNLGSQSTPFSLSLDASTLLAGDYKVTELYDQEVMEVLQINEKGGFDAWSTSIATIAPRATLIFLLELDQTLNTNPLNENELDFNLYPNPTNQSLQIKYHKEATQEAFITIYSSKGIIIYQEEVHDEILNVDTRNWGKGIYFVKMWVDGKFNLKRFVVL
ncbi:MAG: alpha-amylase family glycosyl hydrolase, partial [Bacteroidota bacterium]